MYRLFALVIKELQSLLQEPKTRVILFMPVIVQMILFPFAATLEVSHSKIGIFNQDGGSASIELTQRIAATNTFSSVLFFYNDTEIKNALDQQEVLLVIHFPSNFSRTISHYAHTQLMVLLDGRKSNSAQIAANYISQIVMQYQHELLEEQANISKSELIVRNWYNPNLEYRWFVVPALVSLITTIGIMIVTSLSIVREREEGTLDQLLVSPLTTGQIFAGKAIPALIVATLQATIVLTIGIFFYKIPFAGSLLLFYGALLIYGFSLVGFGLLISSLCNTQQQAFIGVLVFMMPSILLSGYISPIENMPEWLQSVTYINPIRHFMEITKQVYLKDACFSIIWHSLWPLMIITLITSSISYYLFGKKIS